MLTAMAQTNPVLSLETCDRCGDSPGSNWDTCTACLVYESAQPLERPSVRTDAAERRVRSRQRPVLGGSRVGDPPLTTRACADWMNFTTEWVRAAIDEGVVVNGARVMLAAETMI